MKRAAVLMLSATVLSVEAATLAKEFDLEYVKDYFARARKVRKEAVK